MCSWTPKISCTTRTTGNGPPVAGMARYAGISPSFVGILTSPASNPLASVVIVSADTGRTAMAKPAASVVTTKLRRVVFGSKLSRSSCMGVSPYCGYWSVLKRADGSADEAQGITDRAVGENDMACVLCAWKARGKDGFLTTDSWRDAGLTPELHPKCADSRR